MAEAIGNEPVMIMEGVARLDFCDTKIVATMLLPSPPSVALGGAVHHCTNIIRHSIINLQHPSTNEL